MLGGILRRAPRLIQHIGCEWLYRLLLEPGRLWKRYFLGNCRFLVIVLRQAAERLKTNPNRLLHALRDSRPRHAPAMAKE